MALTMVKEKQAYELDREQEILWAKQLVAARAGDWARLVDAHKQAKKDFEAAVAALRALTNDKPEPGLFDGQDRSCKECGQMASDIPFVAPDVCRECWGK